MSRERPLYSKAWRAKYGQTLTREEIRLLQGYRGLPVAVQARLLAVVSDLVGASARKDIRPSVIIAAQRAERDVSQAEDAGYHWTCDEPAVTKRQLGGVR